MTKFRQPSSKQTICRKVRRQAGVQLAEMPPALTVLFFIFLFPGLNLLYLCFAFGAGWFLNNIEMREVACHTPTSLGIWPPTGLYQAVDKNLMNESKNWNGLMGVTEDPSSPEIAQFPAGGTAVLTSKVKTTVSIRPLMIMPLFSNLPWLCEIPGVGKPVTFTYYGTIQQEEPGP